MPDNARMACPTCGAIVVLTQTDRGSVLIEFACRRPDGDDCPARTYCDEKNGRVVLDEVMRVQ